MDLQIVDPTAADWFVFALLHAPALVWYPRWAARAMQAARSTDWRHRDPHDQIRQRIAAYKALSVLLIVAMMPWLVLGLIS